MAYWDKFDWNKIKKDIQKGIEEGMVVLKKGAAVAQKKAGELTEDGKRQYKILELKTKIHKKIYDLGGRVYSLAEAPGRAKNPATHAEVKEIVSQIRGIEGRIAVLEGKRGSRAKKKAAARKR